MFVPQLTKWLCEQLLPQGLSVTLDKSLSPLGDSTFISKEEEGTREFPCPPRGSGQALNAGGRSGQAGVQGRREFHQLFHPTAGTRDPVQGWPSLVQDYRVSARQLTGFVFYVHSVP